MRRRKGHLLLFLVLVPTLQNFVALLVALVSPLLLHVILSHTLPEGREKEMAPDGKDQEIHAVHKGGVDTELTEYLLLRGV